MQPFANRMHTRGAGGHISTRSACHSGAPWAPGLAPAPTTCPGTSIHCSIAQSRASVVAAVIAETREDSGAPPERLQGHVLQPRMRRRTATAPPPPPAPPPPSQPAATAAGPWIGAASAHTTRAESARALSPAEARPRQQLQPQLQPEPPPQQPQQRVWRNPYTEPRSPSPPPRQRPPTAAVRDVPSPAPSPLRTPYGNSFALRTGLALTFLGTNSGAPTLERNVSCTLVRVPGAVQMVDCGEGTHRQLMALRGSLDLAEIDGIFITHLHGDHCFGLAAALALLDEAKAAGQIDPERRRHHVYGPPGLGELVRVSMVCTGLSRRLQLPLTVSELVDSQAAAHPPQPLVQALQPRGQWGPQQRRTAGQYGSRGRNGGGASDDDGGSALLLQRLAPKLVQETPELEAAVQAVQPRINALEEIWSPPRYPPSGQYGQFGRRGSGSYSGSDNEASGAEDDDAAGAGDGAPNRWAFVAAEGVFWDLPGCAGVSVWSAQLQHRVPCWGYVFRELLPYAGATRRRKAVVLGDTVSSRPIAPLAAGCDVISHEATFARGMEAKARIAQHSTGWMAGAFAAAVGARSLVLTHFSARYREGPPDLYLGRTSAQTSHLEVEQQSRAVAGLLQEAAATYGRPDHLFAATDFYTHHVSTQRVT